VLALEGLWLFAQPPEAYLQHHSGTTATASCSNALDAGHTQLLALWPAFLLRLLAHLEAAVTPATVVAGLPAVALADDEPSQPTAADLVQLGVIAPAAPLLFGMLGEALQHLALAWQQQPAAARAALIRATIAESDQPVVVRQRRSAALLGKGKPKHDEVVCGQLLQMSKQLALLLTELLQLERSTCGGPQRDGTVPDTESGAWRCTRLWPLLGQTSIMIMHQLQKMAESAGAACLAAGPGAYAVQFEGPSLVLTAASATQQSQALLGYALQTLCCASLSPACPSVHW
jgi:hypothetical protein